MDSRFKFDRYAILPAYADKDKPLFSGSDTKEDFERNLQTMPSDWHYRFKEVYYNRNYLGYRCKNFEEINKENYFITIGCSFTDGTGLAEDETWVYKLAMSLGMDYLNLGMGGAGPDFINLQSMTFLKNVNNKPKFVVLQWPQRSRQIVKSLEKFIPIVPQTIGTKGHQDGDAISQCKWSIKSNSYIYESYISYISTQTLWYLANVPVFNWTIDNQWNMGGENLATFMYPTPEDLKNMARDLLHFGHTFHARVAQNIKYLLKKDPKFNIKN